MRNRRIDKTAKRFQKYLVLMLGIVVIWAGTSAITFGAYTTLYERYSKTENLADGVVHQTLQRFTDEGWINVNIIRVALDSGAEIVPLTAPYLSERDTLSKMIEANDQSDLIVGGLNTDYFGAATIGGIVKNGEVVTTSVGGYEFGSFNLDQNNIPMISYLPEPVHTLKAKWWTFVLDHINKPHLSGDTLALYTHYWGEKSFGNTIGAPVHEVLVEDGVVVETRRSGVPFDLKEGAYVIAATGNRIFDIEYRLSVGTEVEFNADDYVTGLKLSLGGGAQLVKEGQVVSPFSLNVSGLHPRSALGINADRNELILVAVDGRTASFRGLSQTELAKLMLELGAYEAINFDGGGSTQMMGKSPWLGTMSILNAPSDQSERRIFTGIGVAKAPIESPELKYIKATMASDQLLLGVSSQINVQAIDSNYTKTLMNDGIVQYKVEGVEGRFENNAFVPESTGNGVLIATYQGKKSTFEFAVSDMPLELNVSPTSVNLSPGESVQFHFSVITEYGNKVAIPASVIETSISDKLGIFNSETGIFTAGDSVTEAIWEFKYAGLTDYVPAGIGIGKVVLADFESPTGTFSSYPSDVSGNFLEIRGLGLNGSSGGMLTYDFTETEVTRAAYMNFNTPVILPEGTTQLTLSVNAGGGNGHWLRGRVFDGQGTPYNITFARTLDWEGYQEVTADIPSDLEGPLTLDRIYLVETDPLIKDKGGIYLDDLKATVSSAFEMDVPEPITRYADVMKASIPQTVLESERMALALENLEALSDRITTVALDNSKQTFKDTGGRQWTQIMTALKAVDGKPLIFIVSDPQRFKDPLEKDLFYQMTGAAVARGVEVLVIYPTSGDTLEMDYINRTRVIHLPEDQMPLELGLFDGGLYFNLKQLN